MAPLPIITDAFYCAISGTHGGTPWAVTFGIHDTTGVHTPAQVATAVSTAWAATDSFGHIQVTSVTISDLAVTELNGVSPTYHLASPAGGAGQKVGGAADVQTACAFKLLTGTRGKSHRGRMMIPGVSSAYLTATSAGWDIHGTTPHLEDVWPAWDASLGADYSQCVISRKLSTAGIVTSASPRTTLGTVRRRAGA